MVENIQGLIKFGQCDGQGRRQREHVAHRHLEIQSALERFIHHLFGLIDRRLADTVRVSHREFDAEQQTKTAHVGDEGVPFRHFAQSLQGMFAKLSRAFR